MHKDTAFVNSVLSLAIVGDLLPMAPLPQHGAVAQTLAKLREADVAFGNLEAAVSRRGAPVEKLINLRIGPDRLLDLQKVGFKVMTIANNHTLDFGLEAFFDTISLLRDSNIVPVGGGRDLKEAWTAAILTVKGLKLAFLGAASTLPPGFAAAEGRAGIAPIRVTETFEANPTASMEQPGTVPYVHTRAWPEEVERAQAAIEKAKADADFVIFAIHWGVPPFWRAPFQGDLAEYQRPVGQALIEAGADLVVGHHPHSLQGIEVYQGKPIFHSIGNFIFHAPESFERTAQARNAPYKITGFVDAHWAESMMLNVALEVGREVSYEIWPVLLDKSGNPHLLEGDKAQAVIQRLAELSLPLGGELVFAEGRGQLVI
jgi:poly-gamma-glutamate synthesis protein (capsule biosynthesis protein)